MFHQMDELIKVLFILLFDSNIELGIEEKALLYLGLGHSLTSFNRC